MLRYTLYVIRYTIYATSYTLYVMRYTIYAIRYNYTDARRGEAADPGARPQGSACFRSDTPNLPTKIISPLRFVDSEISGNPLWT